MKFAALIGNKIVNTVILKDELRNDPKYIEEQSRSANSGKPCEMLVSLDGRDPEPRKGDFYDPETNEFIFVEPPAPSDPEEPAPPQETLPT